MAEGIEYSQQQILKLENDLIEMKAERSILTVKVRYCFASNYNRIL